MLLTVHHLYSLWSIVWASNQKEPQMCRHHLTGSKMTNHQLMLEAGRRYKVHSLLAMNALCSIHRTYMYWFLVT